MCTNSRSRMLSATERICRAGKGQLKAIRITEIASSEACPFMIEASRIRIGRLGTAIVASIMKDRTRSTSPPRNPADSPAMTPITVAKDATITPSRSEFPIAQLSSQKMSWPRLVVPSQWARLGGRLRG